jgi:hypothetical protein
MCVGADIATVREQAVKRIGCVVGETDRTLCGKDPRKTRMLRGRESPRYRFATKPVNDNGHEHVTIEPKQCDRVAGNQLACRGDKSPISLLCRDVCGQVSRDFEQ